MIKGDREQQEPTLTKTKVTDTILESSSYLIRSALFTPEKLGHKRTDEKPDNGKADQDSMRK